ncbi:MAG: PBP1A family penicillin-binding protein [Deltaproteobacteria bacterium]|nr:PBP1A family penicillin-binding protein [Deltaproteobacteria bacterium]
MTSQNDETRPGRDGELDAAAVSELKKQADGLDPDNLSAGDEDEDDRGAAASPTGGRRPRGGLPLKPDKPRRPDPAGPDRESGPGLGLDEDFDDGPALSGPGAGPESGSDGGAPGSAKPSARPAAGGPGRGRLGRGGKKGRGGGGEGDGGDEAGLPRTPKARKPRGLFLRLLWAAFWGLLGLAVCGVSFMALGYAFFSQGLPGVEGLRNYKPKTVTYFYGADGTVIGEYSHERRLVRPLSAVPEVLVQAYLATEDADFYKHGGVNPKAVVRAAYNTIVADNLQGGSTITQQMVRSFLLSNERKMERKIKEMILAFRVESVLSKDQILEMYLNQIYLGHGAYGVESAAQTYFDKHVEQLTLAEAAMLAGITQSPEGKNPISHPGAARERQLYSLGRMRAVGFITAEEERAAADEILTVGSSRVNPNTTVAPYFTEQVRRILAEQIGEESLYNDGWKVYTTIDLNAQRAADEAVARGLWEYARRRGFRGPIAKLGPPAEIAEYRAQVDREMKGEPLLPARLYRAVVLEVLEGSGLAVAVGGYEGTISKKGLDWILPKGALSKQLAPGDAVWVRLADPPPPAGGGSDGGAGAAGRQAALAAIAAGGGTGGLDFVLEQRTDVQAALLSMDLSDGGVVAMVGGRDFGESQFNRATQSQRQPGSSFKPIVYTAAMDNGFTPGSVMIDGPVVIDDPGTRKRWKPLNSDRKFLGPITLYNALVASRNLVSIKVLERMGFDALDVTARNMGITTSLPHSPPVALGAHGVTMPEMITAYSSFPNLGNRVDPRYIDRIEDRNGRVVVSYEPVFHRAISPGTACVLTSMLRGVVAQGTGTSVRPLNRPVGGKTGTTNDWSDAWFVGFTPEYVTAVWMGTDELKARAVGEVGGRASGPIFLYYMRDLLKDRPVVDFTVPDDAVMTPGGAYGVCYKRGTLGTGISETVVAAAPDEDFLRRDMVDEDFGDGLVDEDFQDQGPALADVPENAGD